MYDVMDIIPDPIDDFERWDDEQSRMLERLPKCERCGEPIQQESAVRIDNDYYCDECLAEMREWIGED